MTDSQFCELERILRPLIIQQDFDAREFHKAIFCLCQAAAWEDDDRKAAIKLVVAFLIADLEDSFKKKLSTPRLG